MVFNSYEFAIFLVIVYGLYLVLSHRGQNYMLLVASYFFYGFWDWRFLSLLIASTVLDYTTGILIDGSENPRKRKFFLLCSIVGNLGMLGVFKYFDFFLGSFRSLFLMLGMESAAKWELWELVLPVGISFYTFQTLSYAIDIYRRQLKPTRNFIDFALFVTFFPQLVAGPIERAVHLLPQIIQPRRITREQFYDGSWLIFWGLYKKVFVADNVARIADAVYRSPGDYSAFHILIATYAFAVQIYCDFSGYTDIARGLGKIMGFEICLNFNIPYAAKDPQDFWRRWHISLSQWLRDCLYIPLGGGRGTKGRVMFNLMVTMTLGGLWHGAQWHFVIWGVYHGLLLIVYRIFGAFRPAIRPPQPAGATEKLTREIGPPSSSWANGWRMLLMFHLTCLGWVLFRVENMNDFFVIVGAGLSDWTVTPKGFTDLMSLLGYSLVVILMQIYQYQKNDLMIVKRLPVWVRTLLYVIMYLSLVLGGAHAGKQFLYFQF